jgi:hypothetical protein
MHEGKAIRIARHAVDKIIYDMSDRGGMGWDYIDKDIQDEIKQQWRDIIINEILEEGD